MLFDLVDILQKKRRLFFLAAFIIFDFWLIVFCNQTLQAHRPNIISRIDTTVKTQALPAYQSALSSGDPFARAEYMLDNIEIGTFRTIVSVSDGVATAEQTVASAAKAAANAAGSAAVASVRALGAATVACIRLVGNVVGFTARAIAFPFVMAGRGISYASNAVTKTTSTQLASVIQPENEQDAIPVITPEQAQQVSIIQSGTLDIKPVRPVGSGGACDNGAGNGGYPMEWCDAPMDTIRTVFYSSDRINRQCTSYAYWYFTHIRGHTDFRVSGNANRWARTSNYPVHPTPAVGAIAVVTSGYYGHVAIVQALPGQMYDGKVVPEGYVLVSEMNYDWRGHFRYSYSPLSKFSAYIYPN